MKNSTLKNSRYITLINVAFFFLCYLNAKADTWDLPLETTINNTSVSFEVDSTWHLVQGAVKELSGKVWLENKQDPLSIRANLHFPINGFDTDNKSRDKKMRTVMHYDTSPEVVFEIKESLVDACLTRQLSNEEKCEFNLPGLLTINKISKKVTLKSTISKDLEHYTIKGTTTINWADYDIDDPSIFIAKLDPTVKINILINLPIKKDNHARNY